MALLLKENRNTINNRLREYIWIIVGIVCLEVFFFFFFYGISVRQYQKNMEKVLVLNDFYGELDANYQELYSYIVDCDAKSPETMKNSSDQLKLKKEMLKDLQISKEFVRNIIDFSYMFQNYEKLELEIYQKIQNGQENEFTPKLLGEIVVLYKEAGELYDLMISQYRDLHLMLMDEVNTRQKNLNAGMMICYSVIIAINLFLLGLFILRASRLKNKIVEPIQILTEAAELVRNGGVDEYENVEIDSSSYGEILTLVTVFNMTMNQLKNHIRVIEENSRTREALQMQEMENLRITSLLKASELKTLQMQMNPHFLFNTLNIIARSADQGDTNRTVILLQKTAQLLRYNLDYSGRTVTLAKEIEMLGNYVFLQEQRFGSRIFFDFDLDERFHKVQIPSFILQPLVENSVIHGLGQSIGNGEIVICTRYIPEERKGQISILDNGIGMTEEIRESVLKSLDCDEEQREKIGLANVNMRMKILFGENYQLDIYSNPGKETEVRMTITNI